MTASSPQSRRLLVMGRGRMGRVIESLSEEYGFIVAGSVDEDNADRPDEWPSADVAIDFSVGDAVPVNFRHLAAKGVDVVIGTTGWSEHEADIRQETERARIGVVAAPNFALGVNLFAAMVSRAAELMASRHDFGAWLHELHHSAKR